jgi:N-acetylglucosaminyl-diphospho-decaprenol L-rhamnosyltransferase
LNSHVRLSDLSLVFAVTFGHKWYLFEVKLSIVIVCWNGVEMIGHCLRSIFEGTHDLEFEVIISDNGSADGSVEFVRHTYPQVRMVENGANLGYAKGNNAGIRHGKGQYILLLNSDTVVHHGALEKLVAFADAHASAGAFGCQVLNADGSHQVSARRFPSLWRDWLDALCVPRLMPDKTHVPTWNSGCCLLFRANVLQRLDGFDEQFFYSYEDVDLCRRMWNGGDSILYTDGATITHLGSQSANRSPVRFELERHRSRYRYFYKHYGPGVLRQCRRIALTRLGVRLLGYSLANLVAPSDTLRLKIRISQVAAAWNRNLDPLRFIESGQEPPLATIDEEGLFPTPELLGGKK